MRSWSWATRWWPRSAAGARSTRRGGIVDVFPAGQPLPVRVEWFGDEIESLRAFDPADQRGVGPVELARLLPASEFLLTRSTGAELRARLGKASGRLAERLAADLASLETGILGDAAETWGGLLAPATALDHLGDAMWLLDEPGDIDAAADVPVVAGGRASGGPGEVGRAAQWLARRVPGATGVEAPAIRGPHPELTWESEADGAPPGGNPFGWHEPSLPPVAIGDHRAPPSPAGVAKAPGWCSHRTNRRACRSCWRTATS